MTMSYFLSVIVPAIIAIIVAIVIERVLVHLISSLGKKKQLPSSHVHLLKLIVRWVIIVVFVIVVVSIFGIGIGNLWATLIGLLAMVIIGFFAVWSALSNILAAVIILVWRPFHIGDKVAVLPEGLSGKVLDMNLIYTKLETEEGDILQFPNNAFITKFIKVYSKQ